MDQPAQIGPNSGGGEARHGLTAEEIDLLAQAFDLARRGHLGLLDVIDRGLPVNLTNDKGDTLLILAAYYQQAGLVTGLIQRGADLDRRNDRGQTALGCAVFRRSAPIVDVLLAAGADPDAGGPSARDLAAYFGLEAMTALLSRERGDDHSSR